MLLKKIKTKGFIGHLGGVAENDFVELDFADKCLWLIQGRNGSGKSTLFDAITMAFYKQHRGGASNFSKLIHDKADRAEIFVEFAFHGNDYRIAIDIPKKSTVVRSLQFWNGVEWTTKKEGVDEWVSENLKIKYDTFVSSVLLRQGEADKFITALPTPRRKIFLELLQLDFYKKLTDRARLRQKIVNEKLKEIRQNIEGLNHPSASAIKKQEKEVRKLKKQIEKLEIEKLAKQKELDNAEKAQKLKSEIEEIQAQQKLDSALFENAAVVEKKYNYFVELKENLFRIENVWGQKKELSQLDSELETNEEKLSRLKDELENVAGNLTKNLLAQEAEKKKISDFEGNLTSAISTRDETQQKINEILHIEKCEVQVIQETEKLPKILESISRAKEKLNKISTEIEEKNTEKEEFSIQLQQTNFDFQIWTDRLENRQKVVDKDECPTCGNELKFEETRQKLAYELEEAKRKVEELGKSKAELKKNHDELEALSNAIDKKYLFENENYQTLIKKETETKTKIETLKSQITVQYSKDDRETIRSEFAMIKNQVEDLEKKVKKSKENIENIAMSISNYEKSKARVETELENTQENLEKLKERKLKTQTDLSEAEKQISEKWRTHPALKAEKQLQQLREEKIDLQNIEGEYKSLSEARDRKVTFKAKIDTFTKQLNEIPEDHWREISKVQTELDEITRKLKVDNTQLGDAENICREMTADKKLYDEKSVELKYVRQDLEIWKKLAKALGKDGLETKVVREAQLKIRENANKTLQSLSNGNFQLELEDSGKEMKIFVRDFSTDEQRQVEYCSGGEKFLTAVSLAVAIGQSISGQNIANTLIIDEGFGALDDKNRVSMVNELSRLTEVFQNGRIIIVSHQDDVQENFANSYRLSRNDEGFTSVQIGTVL